MKKRQKKTWLSGFKQTNILDIENEGVTWQQSINL